MICFGETKLSSIPICNSKDSNLNYDGNEIGAEMNQYGGCRFEFRDEEVERGGVSGRSSGSSIWIFFFRTYTSK